MRVGVTGANGFIGQAVLAAFAESGHDTIPFVRRSFGLKNEVIVEDFSNPQNRPPEQIALDCLVHLVARTHMMNDKSENCLDAYRAINVLGTAYALEIAKAAGAKRFIFLSSIKVNGESTALGIPFTEEDIPDPQDAYGISKLEAEKLVIERSAKLGIEFVIIRPPLVYGQQAKGNFHRLVKLVNSGLPIPFGKINNARSMIYVDNLASAILQCAVQKKAAQKLYLVSDGKDFSTPELVMMLAKSSGRSAVLINLHTKILIAVGVILRKSNIIYRLLGSLQVSNKKICADLNWKPPYSAENGIKKSGTI